MPRSLSSSKKVHSLSKRGMHYGFVIICFLQPRPSCQILFKTNADVVGAWLKLAIISPLEITQLVSNSNIFAIFACFISQPHGCLSVLLQLVFDYSTRRSSWSEEVSFFNKVDVVFMDLDRWLDRGEHKKVETIIL